MPFLFSLLEAYLSPVGLFTRLRENPHSRFAIPIYIHRTSREIVIESLSLGHKYAHTRYGVLSTHHNWSRALDAIHTRKAYSCGLLEEQTHVVVCWRSRHICLSVRLPSRVSRPRALDAIHTRKAYSRAPLDYRHRRVPLCSLSPSTNLPTDTDPSGSLPTNQ